MGTSDFLVTPLAALIAVVVVVFPQRSAVARKHPFVLSAGLSFLLGIFLFRPWEAISLSEWPFLLLSLGLLALWAAAGTLVGLALGMLLLKTAGLILRALRPGSECPLWVETRP